MLLACATVLGAQAQPVGDPGRGASAILPPVTVTGSSPGPAQPLTPLLLLEGEALRLRQSATLGETLDGTPGVSSTQFGPNANRPMIRGLDGDRIRILSNGGASLDVSGLSYDHAVPLEPVNVERIEVLRGPAALLYGGSAVGGVVNVIDNRIPKERLQGLSGRADAGLNSADKGRSAAAMLEAGDGSLAWHVDASARAQSDLQVPRALACWQGERLVMAQRVCNSSSRAQGGAVGSSVFFGSGRIGASLSDYRSEYGTVAQDDVRIGMRSSRAVFDGEWREPFSGWQRVQWQFGRSFYQHTEFEAGMAGTRFANQGVDWRVQARHASVLGWQGVVGAQGESGRFSADGDEAFAPYSRTRHAALFVLEEKPLSWGHVQAGLRAEQVVVASLGHPVLDRFAPGERRFTPLSAAVGAGGTLAAGWRWSAQWSHSERAPRDYELFANGPHVATAAYEIGNPALQRERSRHVEAGLQWQSGTGIDRASFNVYESRFANFIGLDAQEPHSVTASAQPQATLWPSYAYRAVRARFIGGEASGLWRVARPLQGRATLDLEWRADLVQATDLERSMPLPRMAPLRLGATMVWREGAWSWRVGLDQMATQTRVPAGQQPTAGYTLWHAAATWRIRDGGGVTWDAFARLNNATDRLAYSATSILTQTAPGRSPLPGRSLRLGLQARF